MMKMFYLIGYLILLYGCAPSIYESTATKLSIPMVSKNDSYFKNNFEIEKIIAIETTDEYLLSGIKRIIRYKDKLIILERKGVEIFVVNVGTGKVETHINRRGRGPGESMHVCDIAFDNEKEQILIFNDYEKLLYFGLDGSFIGEEKIGRLFENIIYDKGKIAFYNVREGYSCFPHSINIYDPQNKSWENIGKDTKIDFPIRGNGCLMVKSKHIWYSPILSSDLCMLGNHQIDIPYTLNMLSLPDDLKKKAASNPLSFIQDKRQTEIIYYIHSIRETENFLIFKTNFSGFLTMDKKDSELHWTLQTANEEIGVVMDYFPHDGDDNSILFIIRPDEWFKRQSNQSMESYLRKQIDALNVNEESNPILVFYKEKEKIRAFSH